MDVLLSIKPEFADKIFSGQKKYEYRKAIFKKDVNRIVVYASNPIKKIIGEFSVRKILIESPEILWRLTGNDSGINKDFFFEYFLNRNIGYAIMVEKASRYHIPIDPKELDDKFTPPQSFKYLNSLD